MANTPYGGPVQSRTIDLRTLVASLDPRWRDPAETYLFPNGRTFTENQSAGGAPAPPAPVIPANAYLVNGTGQPYAPTSAPADYYIKE